MGLIHKLEPLWWLLFGAGGFAAAMILPAFFLCVLIAFPLGLLGEPIETFQRMRTLFANPVGQLVLIGVLVLTFWHAAHHIRHLALDLGLESMEGPVSVICYSLAGIASLATIGIVGAL
jgi:fumarate reductase subunit D